MGCPSCYRKEVPGWPNFGNYARKLTTSRGWIYTVFFSVTSPTTECLFSAPRGLCKSIILTRFSPLPGICAAPRGLKKSITSTRFCSLSRVPAQGVEVTCVLRVNEGIFKNDIIRHLCRVSKWVTGNSRPLSICWFKNI